MNFVGSAKFQKRFFLFVSIITCAIVATGPLQDPDLWWHIKTGEIIVKTHSFPSQDIYSYTANGNRWRAYSWLPEIVFRLIGGSDTTNYGMFRLILLRIFLLCLTGVILFFASDKLIRNPQFSAALVFVGWCSVYPLWELRPHIFSMMFLAFVAAVLIFRYEGEKFLPVWVLPFVFLVWANCHIYFVWGLVIWAAFLFFSFLKDYTEGKKDLLPFVASILATFVNPYGFGVWHQFWELANHSWTWNWVMEMSRPWPWDTRVAAFWLYVVLSLIALWFLRRGLRPFYVFLLTFSFAFSMTALRHIFMYPIVSIPTIAAVYFSALKKNYLSLHLSPVMLTRRISLVMTLAFVVIFSIRIYADYRNPIASTVPTKAVDFIMKNKLPSPILNYFDFGGYMIYRLWPDYKVFIDGRTQVYSPQFLEEYTTFQSRGPYNIEDIKKVVQSHKIKTIIWASDHPLASEVFEKIYPILYKDKTAVVMLAG